MNIEKATQMLEDNIEAHITRDEDGSAGFDLGEFYSGEFSQDISLSFEPLTGQYLADAPHENQRFDDLESANEAFVEYILEYVEGWIEENS